MNQNGGIHKGGFAVLCHRNGGSESPGILSQQNEIPQSTLGYWIRKIQSEIIETEGISDPIFARLPMEQELVVPIHTGTPPVTILLPENIRIEVGADCPVGLMAALLQALKGYA